MDGSNFAIKKQNDLLGRASFANEGNIMNSTENECNAILGLDITEDRFSFTSSIESVIIKAKGELADLQETIASVQKMK